MVGKGPGVGTGRPLLRPAICPLLDNLPIHSPRKEWAWYEDLCTPGGVRPGHSWLARGGQLARLSPLHLMS